MTEIQPVYGSPALTVDSSLVIADLHIGVEAHLMSKGFHIRSHTEDMYDEILSSAGDCNKLFVLGDVKNSVPGSSKQEYREIPDFFIRLTEVFNTVTIVRGNHDTNIEEYLPAEVKVMPATGMKVGDVGFVHGHTWPSEDVMHCGTLVMAHNHPAMAFVDGVGKQMTEPCWVRGDFVSGGDRYPEHPNRFIVVPAFNRILGGSPVNAEGTEFLGPLMKKEFIDLDDMGIYLLDGIYVGKRKDNMVRCRLWDKGHR
ncbi:MAG: metallophosphoesterase [Candidatus Methanomethylophilaceae archaeon]